MEVAEYQSKLRKYKGEQSIYYLFTGGSIGFWSYYYSNSGLSIELFTELFLPYLTIAQIALACTFLLFFLFTRGLPQFLKAYQILYIVLLLILMSYTVLIIGVWIKYPNLFESENKGTQCIMCSAELAILFTFYIALVELRIQRLLITIQDIEIFRNLLMHDSDDFESWGSVDKEKKQIRVNSVLPSEMNIVYGNQCTICDEETETEVKAVQLQCLHVFHSECIRKWLENSKICPNCRQEVCIQQ